MCPFDLLGCACLTYWRLDVWPTGGCLFGLLEHDSVWPTGVWLFGLLEGDSVGLLESDCVWPTEGWLFDLLWLAVWPPGGWQHLVYGRVTVFVLLEGGCLAYWRVTMLAYWSVAVCPTDSV